jgi:UDP-N-acetylmuramate--alanine ligase
VITYGFHESADYRAVEYQQNGLESRFIVKRPKGTPLSVCWNLPGKHNVQNALAAIAVAVEEGVSDEAIIQALADFAGVGRRFHIHGDYQAPQGTALIVEDYGHHPNEVRVTIDAARSAWPNRRLVMAFQPHRYSRTSLLLDDFASVLSEVDVLLMCEIYSAGEEPIAGVDSRALCRAIRARCRVEPILVPFVSELPSLLDRVLQENDVVLLQGAGNIGSITAELHIS